MIKRQQLVVIVSLFCCGLVGGCDDVGTDLSQTPKYASTIGAYYRTKVELYALGIYSTDGSRKISKIVIATFPDTGREVASRQKIPIGQTFRVVAIRKRFVLLENGIEFIVATEGLNVPAGLEIILPLYAEFTDTEGFPDQDRFEKVELPFRR